ncbi:amino acid transporter [Streptomyces sp. SAI-133]|nr:amino acid transporter [Streptomyces sp. SAI-133]
MRTMLAAATGLPTILLTAALVVVVCFWLLVAVGVAGPDSFDTDVDLRAWRMGGVPVAVALSVLTVLAWSLSVGAAVVIAVTAPPEPFTGLLGMVVPVGALLVAWATTRLLVRLLHRLFPDEPAPPEPSAARGSGGPEPRGTGSRDLHRGVPPVAVRRPRDRAA